MSFLNLLVSIALGVSPDELSAVQRAAEPKQKHKYSVYAESSSSSNPQVYTSNPSSSTGEGDQQENKDTKEAESGVETYRPEDKAVEREGELPKYSAASGELPVYSKGSR